MGYLKLMAGVGLILFIFILVGILVSTSQNLPTLRVVPPPEGLPGKRTASTCVGYGWSTNGLPNVAVQEAAAKIKEVLGENEPEFILLFCSSKYDEEAVLREVNRQFPHAKVHGGTSPIGVLSPRGFHISENGSLVMMGIHSTRITFGVGYASFDELPPEDAGEVAVRRAIEDAGIEEKLPELILVMMAFGKEEYALRGIARVVGENVPVFGGGSGYDGPDGSWKQFANDSVLSNGISVVAVYTDLLTCHGYSFSYEVMEYVGKITRAQDRIIYEIDGRPAAEVYTSWTGGLISETYYWPLAKIVRGPLGKMCRVLMYPASLENGAIRVYAEVEDGMDIMLLHGTWELLLNQPRMVASRAVEGCIGEKSFSVFYTCAGTIRGVPEGERAEITHQLNQVLGDTPFIGTLVFGAQGFLEGVGNIHGNLVSSIVVFSEVP